MNRRRVLLIILSFAIAILMLANNSNILRPECKNLWILPLVTSICYLFPVYNSRISAKNYISIIVDVIVFIRNCLSSYLCLGYPGYIIVNNISYINNSILLLSFETIAVLFYVFYATKQYKREEKLQSNDSINEVVLNLELGSFFYLSFVTLLVFCAFCVFSQPELLNTFTPIWEAASESYDIGIIEEDEPNTTILSTAFYSLFGVFRILVVVFLINLISKTKKKNILTTSLLLLAILFPSVFTSEDFGNVMVNVLVSFLFTLLVYNSRYKSLTTMATSSGLLVLALVLVMKGFNESAADEGAIQSASSFLQAYFPGVNSVAGVFNINNIQKPASLFYDIYFTIPFRNTLFAIPGDLRATMYFNQSNGIVSQIIPCVGQLYIYIGYLAPIVSALPVLFAYRFMDKINQSRIRALDYVFIYSAVYCALTPFMYNYTILGSWLFMNILFAYIVLRVSMGFKIIKRIC